ncbi:A/G-specific adenine glycosylase [Iamia sp. SCSIO 61187]|uniref:A/G-specific adenine glycosylase n=1 Tax=Iamia sp. SCSIO 61187 TaxID=2722752 RepID=UPI001C63473F|nr:A/G-specific adenine glycosylase [Iamia sp. SCSIO 61187]QYG90968.1 A/G-specific adenine glycosylase [Iamia sp. SCSIO 61187]
MPPRGVTDAGLVVELAAWFGVSARDLPWRRTRDPWAILVSELMLQQTGVTRVEPRFAAFLDRFPTPAACAAVPAGDVVEEWQGLGYNRRAVNLHRCAVAVVADHAGALPTTLEGLLALPGVGPYTARAVLAFAHEQPVACMDVNVTRALSRLVGRPVDQATADALAVIADGHAPGGAWAWNQAVMELGATMCRPRPACDRCPVAARCTWRGSGAPDPWVRQRPQSRFEGSDRQGRGRLVDALRAGAVAAGDVPAAMGWPDDVDRATRVAATLVADGLAVVDPTTGTWHLP